MRRSSLWIKIGLLVAIIGAYFAVPPINSAVNRVITIFTMVNISAMKSYILSFGIWAPIISFLLMVFQSVIAPLPAFIITFANAGLFGWVKGAALSWSSAMAGAALCFGIARYYGRGPVERLTSKYALEEVDRFFDRYGKFAILVCRLLPFVSFDVVSYAAGLTSMGFGEFFWATGLGQLPATLVYSYVGDILVGSMRTLVMGLLIMFALGAVIAMIRQIMRDKTVGEDN